MVVNPIAIFLYERYRLYITVLGMSELVDKLDDQEAHYTVFAPTEDAFKGIDAETLEMWKKGEGKR